MTLKNQSKMKANRIMPTKLEILDYWVDKIVGEKHWLDIYYDVSTLEEKKSLTSICFACGSNVGTERCHITPKFNGGNDDVSNLHLLCRDCHIESELYYGEYYLEWFKFMNPTRSCSYLRLLNKAVLAANVFNEKKSILPEDIRKVIEDGFNDGLIIGF